VDPSEIITAQEGLEHRWMVRKEVRDVELNDRYVLVAKISELD
jgi:hypothetical protein